MRALAVSLLILLLAGCQHPARRHVQHPTVRQKQLFVVIDDAGLSLDEAQQFLTIPLPMTLAVLPHQRQTVEVCRAIRRQPQMELILHQPMEARDAGKNPGEGAIYQKMTPAQVGETLRKNLAAVPGAVGMNNHMGSRITENPQLMGEVLRFCKANDLFFLDSKTAYNSVVPRAARTEEMHVEQRHVFLDIQHDRAYVRRMWSKAVAHARENGYAVVIGHAWNAETAAAIRDSYQTLMNQGYTFHTLSELYP